MVSKIIEVLNYVYNHYIFRRHRLTYPIGLKIFGMIRLSICGNAKLSVGDGVRINSSWRANPSGGGQTSTLLNIGQSGHIILGDNVGISNSTIVAHKKVVIGKNTKIGVNCVLYDTDFHSVNIIDRNSLPDKKVKIDPINIGQNVWICGHCIILKGVTIGNGSIIGAGSVVTQDIPPNELWGGNPAKFIKKITNVEENDEV
jgi:acetyltransferase-like isoleucine patch superfamily enzyme